jgi:hypothetical protein
MKRQGDRRSVRRGRCLLWFALIGGIAAVPEQAVAGVGGTVDCAAGCTSDRSCTFDGIENIALGNATLSINASCHLVVSNIGSSGQDGFSQVLLPSNSGEVVTLFAGSNFAQSQVGAKETMTVFADVPGGVYYTKTIENTGQGTLEIHPDFSPVGATLYTITVMDGNTVTGVFPNLPSPTFSVQQGDQEEIN